MILSPFFLVSYLFTGFLPTINEERPRRIWKFMAIVPVKKVSACF
jgi:hypothetical protein